MKRENVKLIIGIIIGVLFTSVTVYAISVKSTNVSFTPEDPEWDVSDVESALNDLNIEMNNVKEKNVEFVPLYDRGTFSATFTKYSGRFESETTAHDGILRLDDSSIFLSTNGGGARPYTAYFTQIDLTDIDGIYSHLLSANDGSIVALCVVDNVKNYNTGAFNCKKSAPLKPSSSASAENYFTDLLDVSKLSGTYYVGVYVATYTYGTSSASIDGIYMLKNIYNSDTVQ